jgi:hypothetical protein
MPYEADRGYLIVGSKDYIACAETLAKSLRYWHPDVKICLLTDVEYSNALFDYVKQFPYGNTGGWTTDWQVFHASPFHETVKLEADMIVSGPVDHWWNLYRTKPVWISTGCRNFHNNPSKVRKYRKIFDKNKLTDVYNAITYWRMSVEAKQFFTEVQKTFENWDSAKDIIQGGHDEVANTDLIYALCEDNYCTPGYGPQIVHMKPAILGTSAEDWNKELIWEIVNGVMRINGHNQYGFVHYHQKYLATELGNCYD